MSAGCEYYENLIFSLPDEGLTDAEAAQLREHLRTCPDCRRLFTAFADAANVLKNDQAEAPAALAEGVMARVLAYEKVRSELAPGTEPETAGPAEEPEAPDDVPETEPVSLAEHREAKRKETKKSRRWIPVAAAACLVAVIGAGAYAGGLFSPKGMTEESAVLEEAPVALSEQFVMTDSAPAAEAAMEFEAAAKEAPEPMPAAEAVEAETAEEDMDAAAGTDMALAAVRDAGYPEYTWENPARVPEGREADFQALIGAADMPEGLTEEDFQLFAAVEFHGVIYEFLQDETGTAMLWRDAAESTYALPSPGTPADLWDIIG